MATRKRKVEEVFEKLNLETVRKREIFRDMSQFRADGKVQIQIDTTDCSNFNGKREETND